MNGNQAFYLCPTCFEATERLDPHHRHKMLYIEPARFDDEQRKPVMDKHGRLLTRAPRWFLQAVGTYRAAQVYRANAALA